MLGIFSLPFCTKNLQTGKLLKLHSAFDDSQCIIHNAKCIIDEDFRKKINRNFSLFTIHSSLFTGFGGRKAFFKKVGSADSQTSPLVISNFYVKHPISLFNGRSQNVNRKLNFSSRFLKNGGAGEEKLFSKSFLPPRKNHKITY